MSHPCQPISLQQNINSLFTLSVHVPRVNSVLSNLLCLVWSVAWSSVAVALAFAAVCFNRVWARIDAGVEGWWKRVITSFLAA
jgi:hypothetical protein